MKKRLLRFGVFILVFIIGSSLILRFPIWRIGSAIDVATGLGAKIACSGFYVSGFTLQQIDNDLAGYSPVTRLLDIKNDTSKRAVTASLYGMGEVTAQYREHLGCTLEFGNTQALDAVLLPITSADPSALSVAIEPAIQKQVTQILNSDNQQGYDSRAILVVKNGLVVAQSYADGYSKDTPLLGWSMAKSVTAMLIGRLVLEQKLAITDTVLFPEWEKDERADISVKELLTMTSGLAFSETYIPGSDSTSMLFTSRAVSTIPINKPLEYTPGTHHSYSSGTANILSKLIFDRLGDSPQAQYTYLLESLIKPLSLDSMVFEPDASGALIGSSYVYANATDWGKLGLLILNNGEFGGNRIFSTDFANAMTTPNTSENEPRYGYQLWLNDGADRLRWPSLPRDTFAMRGNRAQVVLMIPSLNAVVVRLGWTSGRYNIDETFSELINTLGNKLPER